VNVFLWILQILLALVMLAAGTLKLTRSRAKLAESMGWVESFTGPQIKGIATSEVLAALGLILPAATGVAVILTPLAAVGLVLVMVGATVTHLRRGELPNVAVNIVLLVAPPLSPGDASAPTPSDTDDSIRSSTRGGGAHRVPPLTWPRRSGRAAAVGP
jgi:uncharacterized membrane protein YphA (DoxX/SURF4 family)